MINYNPIYQKFINDKNRIPQTKMERGKFYQIKKYKYVDGTTGTFSQNDAPIIFTLFVSRPKNIVHAVKVTNIRPDLIKKFFGKFVNEENDLLEIKGGSKQVYQNIVSKVPIVTDEAYRTYLLDGLEHIVELDFDVTGVTPTERKAKFINVKGKKRE